MTNSWYVVIENIPRPSSCRALSGTMARMLPFVSAGDRSYWPATLVEQVGKFITHTSWLGNLDSFKAAHCPCSPLSLFLVDDDSLVPRRRNAEKPKMGFGSSARDYGFDPPFLKPSALTLLVTGGRHIPKTSLGSRPTTLLPECSAIVPRKLPPSPPKRKYRVFG